MTLTAADLHHGKEEKERDGEVFWRREIRTVEKSTSIFSLLILFRIFMLRFHGKDQNFILQGKCVTLCLSHKIRLPFLPKMSKNFYLVLFRNVTVTNCEEK